MRPLAVVVAVALGLVTHHDSARAGAPGTCDAVAQPGDSAPAFVRSLAAGQTGCLRGGTYNFTSQQLKVTRPGVTITSYPGERATLVGRLWVARGANRVTVSDLDLDGRNSRKLPSPTVNADETVWHGLDITNGHTQGSCLHLGPSPYGKASRTLIEDNRIHDCGKLPATNHHHGIYIVHAGRTVVRDNLIYDNADRGVQLFPDARRTQITANVIDGNGEGVLFSGDARSASSENLVEHNIISNSKVRYNVESYWPGRVGVRNLVRRNCLHASNPRSDHFNAKGGVAKQVGFRAIENLIADPLYVDRPAKDFRLRPGSPCRGYGP